MNKITVLSEYKVKIVTRMAESDKHFKLFKELQVDMRDLESYLVTNIIFILAPSIPVIIFLGIHITGLMLKL